MSGVLSISREDEAVLNRFITRYMQDWGIVMQLTEAVHRYMVAPAMSSSDLPEKIYDKAFERFHSISDGRKSPVDLNRVIAEAPSVEFVVRFARKIDPLVMPPRAIPSEGVMATILTAFHATMESPT